VSWLEAELTPLFLVTASGVGIALVAGTGVEPGIGVVGATVSTPAPSTAATTTTVVVVASSAATTAVG
jgi:hypothetical protein